MRFFVKCGLAGCSGGLDWNFGSWFFVVDGQLGSGRLRNFRPQVFLGKILCFAGRQLPHFAKHAIKFALCGIALRITVDKLLKDLLRSLPLVTGHQRVSQVGQRVR